RIGSRGDGTDVYGLDLFRQSDAPGPCHKHMRGNLELFLHAPSQEAEVSFASLASLSSRVEKMMLPASTFSFRPVSHPPGRKHDATPTHGRIKLMGLTYVRASVIHPADPKKKLRLRFRVDSGA